VLLTQPDVFLIGEDIGKYGGCFAVTKGLLEEFGEQRIRDAPLSESAFVGAGIGAALAGMRPVVEIMTVNFSLLALDQILNTAATLRHMSGGQCSAPLVIRMATGAGRQVAARLGTHLAAGSTPPQWLDTLRAALTVPGIMLRGDAAVVASSGTIEGTTAVTELRADGEHVGDLVVALPADQLRLPPQTAAVLALIAPPLAQTLHAARLTEQLRASQRGLVTALEEERRRMRRDLHDGLGPTLTGIAYSADASANLLRTDPDEAAQILRQLRADTGDAIAEIRRIVYGLRPRALDELGLVGAVRQQVAHLRAADGQPLAVAINAPQDLPELPAAVEVAAYRVVVEAVTNVARHAGVAAADVDFAMLDPATLRVGVTDRGQPNGTWKPGVGLRSMHERVEQIGGTLTIHRDTDGSTVAATIPLDPHRSSTVDEPVPDAAAD
jgi:signal transduction histidine kinase